VPSLPSIGEVAKKVEKDAYNSKLIENRLNKKYVPVGKEESNNRPAVNPLKKRSSI